MFKTRIRKTIRYAEAPVKGTSVLKYDPTGNAAQAYRDLAKEVLNGAKARKHAEGPLAEPFRATEAAQGQQGKQEPEPEPEPEAKATRSNRSRRLSSTRLRSSPSSSPHRGRA